MSESVETPVIDNDAVPSLAASSVETTETTSEATMEPTQEPTKESTEEPTSSDQKSEQYQRRAPTRKGGNLASEAKRQRLLEKEPDTWVCFWTVTGIWPILKKY